MNVGWETLPRNASVVIIYQFGNVKMILLNDELSSPKVQSMVFVSVTRETLAEMRLNIFADE